MTTYTETSTRILSPKELDNHLRPIETSLSITIDSARPEAFGPHELLTVRGSLPVESFQQNADFGLAVDTMRLMAEQAIASSLLLDEGKEVLVEQTGFYYGVGPEDIERQVDLIRTKCAQEGRTLTDLVAVSITPSTWSEERQRVTLWYATQAPAST